MQVKGRILCFGTVGTSLLRDHCYKQSAIKQLNFSYRILNTMYLLSSERDLCFIFLICNDKRFLVMYTQRILMHTRCLGILVAIL